MAEKCTIKDVALRSRTSVGTVSRYLNGVGCSPERAGRIRKAIKELHYVPNPHAKAVRSSSKGSIGILISSSSIDNTQWINTVIFALIRKCTAMGVFPSIYEVDCKGDGSDCIQAMEKVDGVVMIGDFDLKFFRCFDRFPNLPAVTFCVPVHCANGISLEIEMDTAMEQMIEHLVSLNHRYIGVVSNLIESNRVKDEAFLKAVHRFYPDYDETLIVKGAAEENYGVYGRKYTAKLLDEHPEITAIFYFSDCFLPGGLGELGKRQLRIPEDISVVSMDNSAFCTQFEPAISSIGWDYELLAENLLRTLFAKMAKRECPQCAWVCREFFCRGSSGLSRQ